MWKKCAIVCGSCLLPIILCGQPAPRWMDNHWREASYPASNYFTGFVNETVSRKEAIEEAAVKAASEAKRRIAEAIVVEIKTAQTIIDESVQRNGLPEQFLSVYQSVISTTSVLDIAGLQVDTWFDKAKKTLYAFAHVNKQELSAYYAATAAADIRQIKSSLHTAAQLKEQHEKAKAHKQYKAAAVLLAKTVKALYILGAMGAKHAVDDLQPSVLRLHEEVAQALAQLELLVYVNSREDLFGKPCTIVANTLKAGLSENGYRFTDDATRADFTLNIDAATRKIGNATDVIVFCYADVTVEWVDNYARESVYKGEHAYKGGSTTFERAGREALEKAAGDIAATLYKIITD